MGRTYAGILGSIAFVTVVARALVDGGDVQNVIISAIIALFAFAALGLVIGNIAQRIVTEGVQASFRDRLQDAHGPETQPINTQSNGAAT